ncbi:MAG: hypothetical protein IJ309_02435 [Clostridia bacterium]|nr:hypothetical protein [Clostridia bacterium]
MKKKLILILSLVALMSCIFVVSVSAEFVFYSPEELPTSSSSVYGNYYTHNCSYDHHVFDYMVNEIGLIKSYAVDIEQFKEFVVYYNVNSYDDFNTAFSTIIQACSDGGCDNAQSYYEGIYNMSTMPEDVYVYFNSYIYGVDTKIRDYHANLQLEFVQYSNLCDTNSEDITVEGFSTYLKENKAELYFEFSSDIESLFNSFYSAGASSSSSGSTGSGSNGSPNISDEELGTYTGDATERPCPVTGDGVHDSASGAYGCEHFQNGYAMGFDDGLRSEQNQSNLQQAFDQGYQYANSEDFNTTVQNRIEESRDTHIEEYKSSTEFTEYLLSEEFTSSENHTKVVAQYCNTEEHINMLLENQNIGVENFKKSQAYLDILLAERLAGKDDGYDLGYEEGLTLGLERGKLDGYALFRESDMFKDTLNQWYQDGYYAGASDASDDGPSIVGLISVIVVIAGILIAAALISLNAKKRKAGKRR